MRLSGPQVPAVSGASGQKLTAVSIPDRPRGRVKCTRFICCSPSSRLKVPVRGVNDPAWRFVEPPVNVGLNGRCAPGQGVPCGPCSILNDDVLVTGALPLHGVNTAVVVYVPQRDGAVSGARSPPKKGSSAS